MPADFPASSLTFTAPTGPITVSSNIQLEFSAGIQAGSGKITITDGITQSYTGRDGSIYTRIVGASDTRVIDIGSAEVAINGDTLTINPSANLKPGLDYHVVIDAGAVRDMAGESFTGLTQTGIYHFTPTAPVTDTTGPTLAAMTLADDTLDHGQSTTLTLTFSEAVQGIALSDFSWEGGVLSALTTTDNIIWTATFTAATDASGHFAVEFANSHVRDLANNASNIADSVSLMVDDAQEMTISLEEDNGESSSDLITNERYQTIYIDLAEQPLATDRVEISINGGAPLIATRVDGEGGTFFRIDAELNGSGTISAKLISASNETKVIQTNDYVIDQTGPDWDPYHASMTLAEARDTGDVGDNTTQFTTVTIDVDLNNLSELQVGDIISLNDLYYDGYEGYELGMRRSAGHVITQDDLDGDGHLSFDVAFDPEDDFPEGNDGYFSLTLAVSDHAGNYLFTNNSLDLHIDRSPAYLEGMSANSDLTKLYLYFSEGVSPAGFKLVNTLDHSEIAITAGMISAVPETTMLEISLSTPLANGAHYELEAVGTLYDKAGNFTLESPLGAFTASLGMDVELGPISISNDSGAADGITNTAAQTFSGSFDGALHGTQFIQVSLNGGDTWDTATVSGNNWSLAGTLSSGDNLVKVRANNGTSTGFSDQASAHFVLDTTAPSPGSAPALLDGDGDITTDHSISETDLTVRALLATEGGYAIGDVVKIVDDDGSVLGVHTITTSDFYGDQIQDIDIDLDTLDEGTHHLHVRVTDIAGNTGNSPEMTVTIDIPDPDTTPPTALLDTGSLTYNASTGVVGVDLTGDYSDAIVEYTLNMVSWFPTTGSGLHREFTTTTGLTVPPAATLRVVDAAGNVGSGVAGVPEGTIVFIGTDWNQNMGADGYGAVFTRGGTDTIMYSSPNAFDFVDGGSGEDTLSLVSATGYSFNATSLAGKLANIEIIKLGALSGSAVMEVSDYHAVTGLGVTSLYIDGNDTASVNIGTGHWALVTNNGTYTSYTSNNITLQIDNDVGIIGTPVPA